MGAACSSTVNMKYRILKNYFKDSKCLTVSIVEGLLPRMEGTYPPVILLGENHNWNESEHRLLYISDISKYWERCGTLFEAMNRTVSNCNDPSSKIVLFLEEKPSPPTSIDEWYNPGDARSNENYFTDFQPSAPYYSIHTHNRFFITRERHRAHMASHYSSGMKIINFDIFGGVRSDLNRINSASFNIRSMKSDIKVVYANLQSRPTGNDAGSVRARRAARKELEKELEPRFAIIDEDENNTHDGVKYEQIVSHNNLAYPKKMITIDNIKTARWIALFVSVLAETNKKTVLDTDLIRIQLEIKYLINRITTTGESFSYKSEMFALLTLCGDALTYMLLVRPRMKKSNNTDVLVFYAGRQHTTHLKRWLSLGGYKQDFKRESRDMADIYGLTGEDRKILPGVDAQLRTDIGELK